MKKIKAKNNANQIIEVTEKAWELLYKEREGFGLYKEITPKKKKVTANANGNSV